VAAYRYGAVTDLQQWLENVGLGQYADLFVRNGVDREILPSLDEEDLERMGIALGHRKRLVKAIAEHRAALAQAPRLGGGTQMSTAAQVRAERRHLTVLFCDVVGSTALATRLDPEDLRDILHQFQHCCDESIQRYGGRIARLMGDGVLAYFGFPIAHEDDAERAVNAALQIIQSLAASNVQASHRIDVRIGIASGRVVVGDLIEDGQTRDFALVGEAPNLASRLQQLARPNQILVAPATRELLGGLFEFEDHGDHTIAGLEHPVRVWRVLRPGSVFNRFEARRSSHLTPLVDRTAELALLRKQFDQVKQGNGQAMVISGEAGIGKSRLMVSLRDALGADEHCSLCAQCSSLHTTSAWYPIIRHLEDLAGLTREMPAAERLHRLEELVGRLLPDQARSIVPLLAALLSIPLDDRYPPLELTPQQQKNRTFNALLSLLKARSDEKPVLFVFEDVHWIDPTSLELVERILDRVPAWRMLVILLSRPEFTPPWPAQRHIGSLTINRLDPSDVAAMVESLADDESLVPTLKEQIVAKTDGVPLFIEEMTKAMLEAGRSNDEVLDLPATVTVPDTLHDSLMARLDQTMPMKTAAQAAAVIGREFSLELLEAVVPLSRQDVRRAIDRLLEFGLLFRSGHADVEAYTFKHALVQDEAYASMLRDERRELHLRIAEALRGQSGEIIEAPPEVVAHHYTQAGKNELAIHHWLEAGRQASMRSAFVEATTHFQIALKLLSDLPPGLHRDGLELQIQHALGSAYIAARGFGAAETSRAFKRALELCQKFAGSPQTFGVLSGVIGVHLMRAEFEQCRDLAEDLLAQALRQDDPTPKLMGHRALGMSLFVLGELPGARDHLRDALALYDMDRHAPLARVFSQDFKATAQIYLALTSVLLGDMSGGLAHGRAALAHAERLRHPHSICYVLPFLAGAYLICRQPDAAYPIAERTITLSAEYGFPLWSAGGLMLRGWAQLDRGEIEQALPELRRSVAALEATDTLIWVQFAHYLLACALAKAGHMGEAREQVDEVLAKIGSTSGRWYEAELHRFKGDLLRERGDSRAAELCYEQAIAVATRQGARLWQLRATNALTALWRSEGRFAEASARLGALVAGLGDGMAGADLQEAMDLLTEHA